MTQFNECVFVRSSDRTTGIQWLKDNDLAGYVLEPEDGWVRVFPQWEHVSDEETISLLQNSSELLVYCYFAEQQYWSFSVYDRGDLDFRYECIWLVDEYAVDGAPPEEIAQRLDAPPDEFAAIFDRDGTSPSWDELVDDAIRLADVVDLPGDIWMTVEEALQPIGDDEPEDFLVGPGLGYGLEPDPEELSPPSDEPVPPPEPSQFSAGNDDLVALAGADDTAEDDTPEDNPPESSPDADVPDEPNPDGPSDIAPPAEEPQMPDESAPWRGVYELASNFLGLLEEEELVELTLDSQLARDRLVERLTNLVVENPVSRDSQVLDYWFDELMTCPEVVDIFATDAMLEEIYDRAKERVESE